MTATLAFHIGCWSLAFLGLGHLITDALMKPDASAQEVIDRMRALTFDMPGRQADLWGMHQGFSTMMGLLLIAFGSLGGVCILEAPALALSPAVLGLNIGLSALGLVVSTRRFFAVPIFFCGLSSLAFIASACLGA
jgi:hypothetical protein